MRAFILLAVLLLSLPASAGDPFLWSVEGPHGTNYIAGSVHLLPASAYPLPAPLNQAYLAADDVVFESDLSMLSNPEVQSQLLSAARDDRPGGLKARLKPELYRKLSRYAAQIGMPGDICDGFRAWFCALTLEELPLQAAGFEPQYGLDQHFFSRAADDDKPVAWLEEPQVQVHLLTDLSDGEGSQLLAATLDGETSASQTPAELLRIWKDGDVATMEHQLNDTRTRYPKIYAHLYSDRNRAWLPQLVKRFKDARHALVIVGLDHLLGPEGLVAQLQAQGFRVQRVPAPPAAPAASAPAAATAAPAASADPASPAAASVPAAAGH